MTTPVPGALAADHLSPGPHTGPARALPVAWAPPITARIMDRVAAVLTAIALIPVLVAARNPDAHHVTLAALTIAGLLLTATALSSIAWVWGMLSARRTGMGWTAAYRHVDTARTHSRFLRLRDDTTHGPTG